MPQNSTYYRRVLPHYQSPACALFVTFRLAGSLPRSVVLDLERERQELLAAAQLEANPQLKAAYVSRADSLSFDHFDRWLAQSQCGPQWLAQPQVADGVAECVRSVGDLCIVEAFCIMPNHAHIVLTPTPKSNGDYAKLPEIMKLIKGRSAYRANQLLGRSGPFWQHESYDHVVRNEQELERIVRYALWNPVKAGLVSDWREWKWSYARLLPTDF